MIYNAALLDFPQGMPGLIVLYYYVYCLDYNLFSSLVHVKRAISNWLNLVTLPNLNLV